VATEFLLLKGSEDRFLYIKAELAPWFALVAVRQPVARIANEWIDSSNGSTTSG